MAYHVGIALGGSIRRLGDSEHIFTGLTDGWNKYIYGYISRLAWAAPFLILLVKSGHKGAIPTKELFGVHFHWKSFLTVLGASTVYVLCRMFFAHGGLWINPNIIILQELTKFLTVGFVEELVYRGFGLNMLSKILSVRGAYIVSSLFFSAVHIPAYFIHWYREGVFSLTEMAVQAATAFIFGFIFGIVFRKSRSVWAGVIVHFWYDFSFVLFAG